MEMVLFRWLSHIVGCGAFDGREITRALRILKKKFQILNFSSLKLFWIGCGVRILILFFFFSVHALMDSCNFCT